MKLVRKTNQFGTTYEDIDPSDKFDHNLLICNGCLYWYQVYNRCTYRFNGESLVLGNMRHTERLERLTCESKQKIGECPYKKYIRYYDKNYPFFLKNKKDELYLKSKRKYEKIKPIKTNSYYQHPL